MKKTSKRFFISAIMMVASVCSYAQGLTATLQQGGKMTPYYGVDAFKEAYAAASNGAVITLSAGRFNSVGVIEKEITIIGNGATGDNSTSFNSISSIGNTSYYGYLYIKADNVKIEGIRFDANYYTTGGTTYYYFLLIGKIKNLKMSHCYIGYFRALDNHTNTIIDQCYIYNYYSNYISINCCLKNSFISEFSHNNPSTELIYFTNCLIFKYSYFHQYSSSYSSSSYSAAAIYKNCILGYHNYSYQSTNSTDTNNWKGYYLFPSTWTYAEYYNNVFYYYPSDYNGSGFTLNDNLKTLELKGVPTGNNRIGNMKSTYNELFDTSKNYYQEGYIKTTLKGDDGKQVGPYGGSGFSMIPSIPRITESTIDSYTNAEGKINVKIKVENNK